MSVEIDPGLVGIYATLCLANGDHDWDCLGLGWMKLSIAEKYNYVVAVIEFEV